MCNTAVGVLLYTGSETWLFDDGAGGEFALNRFFVLNDSLERFVVLSWPFFNRFVITVSFVS